MCEVPLFSDPIALPFIKLRKHSAPSIQVSREKRAGDMNVTFRETISFELPGKVSREGKRRDDIIKIRAPDARLKRSERRFAAIIFPCTFCGND